MLFFLLDLAQHESLRQDLDIQVGFTSVITHFDYCGFDRHPEGYQAEVNFIFLSPQA